METPKIDRSVHASRRVSRGRRRNTEEAEKQYKINRAKYDPRFKKQMQDLDDIERSWRSVQKGYM
jgi:hypothetical protein